MVSVIRASGHPLGVLEHSPVDRGIAVNAAVLSHRVLGWLATQPEIT